MKKRRNLALQPWLLALLLTSCAWQSDYKTAQKLKSQGKFHSAIEYYLSFVEKKPNHKKAPLALLEVGSLQEELLEEVDKAIETFQMMVAFYPITESTILAQERLAKLYKSKKNDYPQALAEFSKLIRAVPHHDKVPEFQLEVADCYRLLHQYAQADLEYKTLIQEHASFKRLDEAFFKKANNNYIQGAYELAISDYQTLIQTYPKSKYITEAKFGLGSTYEALDDFDKAKAYYKEIQESYPAPQVIQIRLEGIANRQKQKHLLQN